MLRCGEGGIDVATVMEKPPGIWEKAEHCDFCGEARSTAYFRGEAEPGGRIIQLIECSACGLVRRSPRRTREATYRGYVEGGEKARELIERKLARSNAASVHRGLVERAITCFQGTPQSLYDFGCGAGTVMTEAAKLGLHVGGHDVNREAIALLREQGLDAVHAYTHELAVDRSYDIVLALDYLDRSFEPFTDLKRCRALLNPGGILLSKTLGVTSPQAMRGGDALRYVSAGAVHFLSFDVLHDMAEAADFTVLDIAVGQTTILVARAR